MENGDRPLVPEPVGTAQLRTYVLCVQTVSDQHVMDLLLGIAAFGSWSPVVETAGEKNNPKRGTFYVSKLVFFFFLFAFLITLNMDHQLHPIGTTV